MGAGGTLLAPPSAPPIAFSADPHYLSGSAPQSCSGAAGRWAHGSLRHGGDAGDEGLSAVQRVLEAEPPAWVPDSASTTCMRCSSLFRPVICLRHHCRFCGHLVCDACSRGRALLPKFFREAEPQRVCDGCFEVLLPVQRMLVATVAPAVQVALHDVTDWSSARAWLNNPWGASMQDEIFKATNTLRCYSQLGSLHPEKAIPGVVLGGARGLALLTVAKGGAGVTYKVGSGVVLSRRPDGSWSAPAAIATVGFGWGAQFGGEIADLIVVLRSLEALKAFCGDYHVAVGASLGAAAGPLGRTLEADVRAGRKGLSTAYTYSCAKGAYVGVSWEYSLNFSCHNANMRFYGSRDCRPADILFSPSFPQPLAARPLYAALIDLFQSVHEQKQQLCMRQQQLEYQQQQQQAIDAASSEPRVEYPAVSFYPGDAMAAAAAGAAAGAAGAEAALFHAASRALFPGNAAGASSASRIGMEGLQGIPGSSEDMVLGPPPPPYDSCYPSSTSVLPHAQQHEQDHEDEVEADVESAPEWPAEDVGALFS